MEFEIRTRFTEITLADGSQQVEDIYINGKKYKSFLADGTASMVVHCMKDAIAMAQK